MRYNVYSKNDVLTTDAPIMGFPGRVICVGKNYADHAMEVAETGLQGQAADAITEFPTFFAKHCPSTADGDIIPLHEGFSEMVDYEVELGVVIGREVKGLKPENAMDAVFGYTIINDVTARDAQTKFGQWHYAKSMDGFCPIGPCIVTVDEFSAKIELDVFTKINGEIRQSSNTKNMIFDIKRLLCELSAGMTLKPGDIIATGTPAGIGHAMNPPVYLKRGDKIECGIEKIGVLTNYVELKKGDNNYDII